MHISWLGHTTIKIQAKPADKDITIIIDPYKTTNGINPRSLTPQIALFTHGEKNSITLSGNPFVLSSPGEIDTQGVLISAINGNDEKHIVVRVDVENMSIGHLGLTNVQPDERQLDILSGVDILCIPVGHPDSYDATAAVKAVNTIEPRVVIPIAFQSDNDPNAKPVDVFLKEIGAKTDVPEKKVILKKSSLPQEETEVIVLAKDV